VLLFCAEELVAAQRNSKRMATTELFKNRMLTDLWGAMVSRKDRPSGHLPQVKLGAMSGPPQKVGPTWS
jgi:hypothetical protein